MSKGNIKHAFPGGNTSLGFFSCYDYIMSQEDAQRIIVIKGGPGVGKSTFMKKIAMEMADRGFNVEFMHCSSDNNSLDGIVIPAIKVAMMDGTAPHVVDPKNPGAVDEIIHLGDYWDEQGISANKEYILDINREVGRIFARAYRYLKAAASVYEDITVINNWAMDNAKVNMDTYTIISKLFGDSRISDKEGKQRHLFASAITPNGLKNYLESILTTKFVYALKGEPGTGTEKLLEKVLNAAVERGYYTECYYCPMNPRKIEHLVIPDLDISFTTVNDYHAANVEICSEINLNEYLDPSVLKKYADVLQYNKSTFNELLSSAVATINRAKELHDKMEAYYIPNMDFEAIDRCWEATFARILEYADMR